MQIYSGCINLYAQTHFVQQISKSHFLIILRMHRGIAETTISQRI